MIPKPAPLSERDSLRLGGVSSALSTTRSSGGRSTFQVIPGGSGSGAGVSGPANAQAAPRPHPMPANGGDGPDAETLRAYWNAYLGAFGDEPLKHISGQPNLNVRANRIKSIVNTGVDFLFGPELKISHSNPKAQELLDLVWGDVDQRMTLLAKLGINGGVYGQPFVKIVTPKDGSTPTPENPPRLVLLNPEQMSIQTDPDDCDVVICYAITTKDTDPTTGRPIERRQTWERIDPDGDDDATPRGADADTTWLGQNWTRTSSGTAWQPDGEPIAWPYAFAPIFEWQNYPNPNDHWGLGDVTTSLVELNQALQLVESNIQATIYSHGHPWVFATGCDPDEIKAAPGLVTGLPAPDSKVFAVNAAGDLANAMVYAQNIRADMDEESSVPSIATGRMEELPKGQLSGVTVRLLYSPLLARTEHKRRLYGQGIRDLCRGILMVCGLADAAEENVQLDWSDPLPSDDVAEAQTGLSKLQIGFSKHSVLSSMGADYDTEADWLKQEAQDQMQAFTMGQGMPPAGAFGAPTADPTGDAGEPNADPSTPDAGAPDGQQQPPDQAPPVNHPRAVAQRQAMKAAGAAVRALNGKPAPKPKAPTKPGRRGR